MSYLFETHLHTKEVSTCAQASAKEIAKAYLSTDCKGIIVTDHLNRFTFEAHPDWSWDKKVDHFLTGYNQLKKEVKSKIPVLLGAEIALYESPNDYLVYGITEDFLRDNGDLMAYSLKDFYHLCKKNGFIVVQAHPFRYYVEPAPLQFIDGVEVYNANASHNGYFSHNAINSSAEQWAKRNKKDIVTAGSDFHDVTDAMTGGIYFERPVNTNEDLLRELRSLNYSLFKNI